MNRDRKIRKEANQEAGAGRPRLRIGVPGDMNS